MPEEKKESGGEGEPEGKGELEEKGEPEEKREPKEKRVPEVKKEPRWEEEPEEKEEPVGKREPEEKGEGNMTLLIGWVMLTIAISLFVLSFFIFIHGLDTVFPGKRFPGNTETPCMLTFVVMGIIFLNLGIVYRDTVVHPEFFREELEEKHEKDRKRREWELIKKRANSREGEIEELLDKGEK